MDTYINTIQTFTQLLQQQPTLFSPGMGEELNQLVSPLQTVEAISNALVEWLAQYSAVDNALQTLENGLTEEEQMGPGGQVPSASSSAR